MLHLRGKITHAINAFKAYPDKEYEQRKRAVRYLVTENKLQTFYQPILNLRSNEIVGFEALNRPDRNQVFINASDLFMFAEQHGFMYDLDLKCRELSVQRIASQLRNRMIFINVNSNVIMTTSEKKDPFRELIQYKGITPKNVVLEITERQAIKDFREFNKRLDLYRRDGFKIAVDDLGAGYSSLQTIAELTPDFIKLDMSLVRGIHQTDFKRILVETLVSFADKSKSSLIAEGIEVLEEFNILKELGVAYGQGYFINKPKLANQIMC